MKYGVNYYTDGKFEVFDVVRIIKGRLKGELAKADGFSDLNMEHSVCVVRYNPKARNRCMGFDSSYLEKTGKKDIPEYLRK